MLDRIRLRDGGATRAASVRRRGLFLLALCSCEAGPLPEESDQAEATVDVELRNANIVTIGIDVHLRSDAEINASTSIGLDDLESSVPLRVSVFMDLACEDEALSADTVDVSSVSTPFIGTRFRTMTSPNDFHCVATITPQNPVVPPVVLTLTFEASAAWQGEIGDVEVALEVTDESRRPTRPHQ
jgi:hypothetical protein